MNKWTPDGGKSDNETFNPGSRIYDSDYKQFCYELGVLLESWSAAIVSENNEISICFPEISSLFAAEVLRKKSVHPQGCKGLHGHAARLIRT